MKEGFIGLSIPLMGVVLRVRACALSSLRFSKFDPLLRHRGNYFGVVTGYRKFAYLLHISMLYKTPLSDN